MRKSKEYGFDIYLKILLTELALMSNRLDNLKLTKAERLEALLRMEEEVLAWIEQAKQDNFVHFPTEQ